MQNDKLIIRRLLDQKMRMDELGGRAQNDASRRQTTILAECAGMPIFPSLTLARISHLKLQRGRGGRRFTQEL